MEVLCSRPNIQRAHWAAKYPLEKQYIFVFYRFLYHGIANFVNNYYLYLKRSNHEHTRKMIWSALTSHFPAIHISTVYLLHLVPSSTFGASILVKLWCLTLHTSEHISCNEDDSTGSHSIVLFSYFSSLYAAHCCDLKSNSSSEHSWWMKNNYNFNRNHKGRCTVLKLSYTGTIL